MTRSALGNIWSFCALMAASWTSRSRANAGAGNVGFNSTSATRSRPLPKSLFNTSALTPKLLLPPKLSMLPPSDSISVAICSAFRFFVPFNNIFAVNCVTPLVAGVSASTPPLNTARNSMNGRR